MRALLVAAAGLLAGCLSAPTADQACDHLAAARCARLNDCSPHSIRVRYGDLPGCQLQEKQACLAETAAPGSSATASFQDGCAQALPALSCLALFSNAPLQACIAPPGRLQDGEACLADAQCSSGTCNRAPDAGTGSCGAPAAAGESCQVRSCARGLVCSGTTPVCVRPGVKDAACDAVQICAIGFSCVAATASCAPAIGVVGGECDPRANSSADCDLDLELVCDPATGTCVAAQ